MRSCQRRVLFCASAVLSAGVIAAASDLKAGKRAYEQGDYATALKELRPLAEQGNTEAQTVLGRMYLKGRGVPKDAKQAFQWYKAAAEQGDAVGEYYVGSMYLMSIGTTNDDTQALKWLTLSAEQGMSDAQFLLGMAYMRGRGTARDLVLADMWLRLAAARGDPLAPREFASAEGQMTRDQVARAQAMAAAWKPKAPSGSDESKKK